MIPFNDLNTVFAPYVEDLKKEANKIIDSGWFVLGPNVNDFEDSFANFIGASFCLGVGNGTDALEISLRALNVEAGDEVITVANAGGYTTSALLSIGATPVYVDIDDNMLISPESVSEAISSKTKAIVLTHLYGQAVDVEAIRRVGGDIPILEDCAEAHGASINGKKIGSLGDIASFSFYPTKNLGALGDGGAIVTSNREIAQRAKQLRQYGWSSKYNSDVPYGRNSRLDEIQAAFLKVLLPHIEEMNNQRTHIVSKYKDATPEYFSHLFDDNRYVGHLAIAVLPDRDEFRDFAKDKDVSTDIHFPVLDNNQKSLVNIEKRAMDLTRSESIVNSIVSLPCFPGLDEESVNNICTVLKEWKDIKGI